MVPTREFATSENGFAWHRMSRSLLPPTWFVPCSPPLSFLTPPIGRHCPRNPCVQRKNGTKWGEYDQMGTNPRCRIVLQCVAEGCSLLPCCSVVWQGFVIRVDGGKNIYCFVWKVVAILQPTCEILCNTLQHFAETLCNTLKRIRQNTLCQKRQQHNPSSTATQPKMLQLSNRITLQHTTALCNAFAKTHSAEFDCKTLQFRCNFATMFLTQL